MGNNNYPNIYTIFDKLEADAKNRLKKALRDSAQLVVNEAKSRVPVKTGRLRDSIVIEDKYETVLFIRVQAKNKNVAYGRIVEFSPVINKPFLYPARDAKLNDIKKKFEDALGEAVKNVQHE